MKVSLSLSNKDCSIKRTSLKETIKSDLGGEVVEFDMSFFGYPGEIATIKVFDLEDIKKE